MDEAISRTEAQLTAARQASLNADAAARERALGAARSELQTVINDFVGDALTLRRRVEALRAAGLSAGARRELLEQAKDAQELLEQLQRMESYWSDAQKLLAVGRAGFQTGTEIRNAARSFAQDVARVNDLFVKTGIWDQLGETAAASFGPLGSLAFRASRVAIDVGVSIAESALSETEYLQAQQNLDAMRYQRSRIESRIFDMQALMNENCTPPRQVASSPTPTPPAQTPPPAAPPVSAPQPLSPPQSPDTSSGGGGAGKTIGLIAGIGGGAAGYALYCKENPQQKMCGGSGADNCGPAPVSQYTQACYNRVGSCSAAIAEYSSWCACSMGGTFDRNAERCR